MRNFFILSFILFSVQVFSQNSENTEKNNLPAIRNNKTEHHSNSVEKDSSLKVERKSGTPVYPIRLSASNYPPVTTSGSNDPDARVAETENDKKEARTVEYYDQMILSVQKKIEWVKNNPEEHLKALETGWYEQMDSYLVNYRMEREKLINRISEPEK